MNGCTGQAVNVTVAKYGVIPTLDSITAIPAVLGNQIFASVIRLFGRKVPIDDSREA
jgi:hypothetical protein